MSIRTSVTFENVFFPVPVFPFVRCRSVPTKSIVALDGDGFLLHFVPLYSLEKSSSTAGHDLKAFRFWLNRARNMVPRLGYTRYYSPVLLQ